jgi:CMP-N-acetylneuraminic acid synthetase
LLGGKPLVARALESALGAKLLNRVVVSSDDDEVLSVVEHLAPQCVLRRPQEIAGDQAPAIDYVRHALETLESTDTGRFEMVVIVQPSSPFTLPEDIDAVVTLLENSPANSAASVMEVDHATHPLKLKRMDGPRLLPYLEEERGRMAAHELPKLFVRNCSVYAAKRSAVDRGEIVTSDCVGYIMPRERSLDINDETDWLFAEFLFERQDSTK